MRRSLPGVLVAIALGVRAAAAAAQPGIEEAAAPALPGLAPLSEVAVLEIPRMASVESRSMIGPDDPDGPFQFADPFAVAAGPSSHGRWEVTSDGETTVWRLRVSSEGAVSLNFGFARYRMPPGGRLRIHTPDGSEAIGPFTEADNEDHGELWTPVLPGGEAVIEVVVPAGRRGEVELEIGSVNRGFRDVAYNGYAIGSRAVCNIDVACSQGAPYRGEIRGVGLMQFGGSSSCSGVLLNNTAEDGRPYFLTARHCGFEGDQPANARSVVVYWNYQKPGCNSGSGSRSQSQSGAWFRGDHVATDIALIELDDDLDPAHELYLAGWDRGGSTVGFPVAIHHPDADLKSITTFSEPAVAVPRRSRVETPDGDLFFTEWRTGGGIIEPGSSGSPLLDDVGRVVGATKSINLGFRCHAGAMWAGRVARAWSSLGSWLDPGSTGATSLDGREAARGPLSLRALDDKAVKAPADGESPEALTVDVAPFFWNGGAMTWTATSSDESAVTVSVSGSAISLTPVAAGSSTITVTATDAADSSRSATRTFRATTGDNRSPEPSGTFADRSLNEAGPSQAALASAFTDGDGDTLTYAASSSDTAVATVALSGSTVTVTAVNGPGTATIDVTATDASGSNTRARHRFDVTVLNGPPQAVGSLADVALQVGDGNQAVDLSAAFSDPEGEALTYRARSSDRSVAGSTLSGSTVTLSPEARGNATFTVWARDLGGSNASATQTIEVRVKGRRGVTVSTSTVTVLEGSTETYTVGLESEPAGEVTITPDVGSSGKITVSPSSLTFDASNWETAQTVTVEGVQDDDSETESATISSTVSGADYGSVTAASVNVTVVDDEGPPVLSTSPASAPENGGSLTFDVKLSHATGVEVSVDYATSDGTAAAGADYTAASGTLTFPAGTTARQILVEIVDDDVNEENDNETFRLTLGNLKNGTFNGGGSTLEVPGTIQDDDTQLHLSMDGSRARRVEGAWWDVPLRLTPAVDAYRQWWRVGYEVTYRGGADWTDATNGLVGLNWIGPSTEFNIQAIDDELDDDCEWVEIDIVPDSPGLVGGGKLTFLIEDDDGRDVDCGWDSTAGGSPPGGGGGPPPPTEPEPEPEPPPPPSSRPPLAAFEVEGASCGEDLCRARTAETVRFTDTSSGTVRFRRWDFGHGDTSRAVSPVHAWSSPGFHEVMLEVSDGASPSTARRTFLVEAAAPAGSCVAGPETACLQHSRYEVRVEWQDAAGGLNPARVVHAGTNDSGLFSFFEADNWEMLVKVLDGCSVNGRHWVYAASATSLPFELSITDTATGEEYRYSKGVDEIAALADTEAFADSCRGGR